MNYIHNNDAKNNQHIFVFYSILFKNDILPYNEQEIARK